MSVNWRDETLDELAEAIRGVKIPDAPGIVKALVEPCTDSDGDPALKALIVLDEAPEGGWSADFTHELRSRVNRLAVEHGLDEHVYVTLFTEEEFQAREYVDELLEDDLTDAIDQALSQDQQNRP